MIKNFLELCCGFLPLVQLEIGETAHVVGLDTGRIAKLVRSGGLQEFDRFRRISLVQGNSGADYGNGDRVDQRIGGIFFDKLLGSGLCFPLVAGE